MTRDDYLMDAWAQHYGIEIALGSDVLEATKVANRYTRELQVELFTLAGASTTEKANQPTA